MAKKWKRTRHSDDRNDRSLSSLPATSEAEGEPSRWRELASSAAEEFKERLGVTRYLKLGERDRERLARRLRDAIDSAMEVPDDLPGRIRKETAAWSARRGNTDPVALAWERTRERGRRTAAVGAATTIPAMIPVLGPAAAALGLVADWRYVAEQQRDLVLEIAALLDVMPENPQEQVRRLFLASAGTAFGSRVAGETVVKVAAGQVARRSVARLVPGVGLVVAGALNYLGTLGIGRAAIQHFAAQAGREARGIIPVAGHPMMSSLRRSVIGAVETAELSMNGGDVSFTAEQREAIERLSSTERDELIDLAIVCAAAKAHSRERGEVVLRQLAAELGVPPERIDEFGAEIAAEVTASEKRFRKLLRSARDGRARSSAAMWKRAKKIARWRHSGARGESGLGARAVRHPPHASGGAIGELFPGVAVDAGRSETSSLRRSVVRMIETAEISGAGAHAPWSAEQRRAMARLSTAQREGLMELAVVTAAANGVIPDREADVLQQLAEVLGISPQRLQKLRAEAETGPDTSEKRFRMLLDSARQKGMRGSRAMWKQAQKLTRRG